jgi:hypothetical protein
MEQWKMPLFKPIYRSEGVSKAIRFGYTFPAYQVV